MDLIKKTSKKISILVLCILSITTFSGCNNSKYTADYDSSNTSNSAESTTFNNNQGQFYMPSGSAAAENGYYYITKNHTLGQNSTNTYFLYFYDMTSQTAVPLCSKLECKHNDSECDAYISDNECLGHMIWYYNGRIFMIERTDENDNLVSYDKEGRNKEKVCVLSDTNSVVGFKDSVDNVACVNNGCLYYEVYNPSNDYVNIKKVELKNDSNPQDIGTISVAPETSSYEAFRFYPLEDNIYIFVKQYISESDIKYCVYQYSESNNDLSCNVELDNSNLSNTYRGNIYKWCSNLVVDNDGNIYYISLVDGEELPASVSSAPNQTCILNKYNVTTKTNSELYILEGTSDKICRFDSISMSGYDGKYIYFYESQTSPILQKGFHLIEDCNNIVVMNTDGTLVDKIHFTLNTDFLTRLFSKNWLAGSININKIIPGDERYIMIATRDLAIEGLERTDEYVKAYRTINNFTETEVLAVFDKKQIGTDKHTWIKVKE